MAGSELTPGFAGTVPEEILTFDTTGVTLGTHEDWPAKMSANGQITISADGDEIQGIIQVNEADGQASMLIKGAVVIGYTGDAPGVGWVQLTAKGDGTVQVATDGTGLLYFCVNDNTTDDEVTILLPGVPYGPAAA